MRKILFLFGELRDNDIDWFARTGYSVRLQPNVHLMHQGQESDRLYIVLEGELNVSVRGIGIVAKLTSGDVVGEMSFVTKQLPAADVIAKTPCRLLAIECDRLHEYIEDEPDFGLRFYKSLSVFLADRLRGTMRRLGHPGDAEADDDAPQNELAERLLDNVHMAGLRFERLVNMLAAGSAD